MVVVVPRAVAAGICDKANVAVGDDVYGNGGGGGTGCGGGSLFLPISGGTRLRSRLWWLSPPLIFSFYRCHRLLYCVYHSFLLLQPYLFLSTSQTP